MLKLLDSLEEHSGIIWSLAWSPRGNLLASCGQDKAVNIYQLIDSNHQVVDKVSDTHHTLSLAIITKIEHSHKRTIRDIAWSPCGSFIALASFDATVSIWEMKSKKNFECITTVEGHESEVKSVAWSPSGECLATCGRDKQVMIWAIINDGNDFEVECESVLGDHGGDVKRVVWHPHDDILMSVGYDNRINIYKHSHSDGDWVVESYVSDHSSTVWAADFDSTGNRIVSCSDDRTLRFHNFTLTPVPPSRIDMEYQRPIYDVSWNKSNCLIATGCGDNLIRVIKETGHDSKDQDDYVPECLTLDVKSHDGDVNRVRWNPQAETLLASCGDDSCVKLWKWFTPE